MTGGAAGVTVKVDCAAGAAYVSLPGAADAEVFRTLELRDDVLVDVDEHDTLIGIEILGLDLTDPTPPVVPAGQEEYRAALRQAMADWVDWDDWDDWDIDAIVAVPNPEVSRLQAIVDRVQYDPDADTWRMDEASQEHMDGLYQQAEEARAERDEARRVVARVNNCADFAEALGLPRDSYGDQIIEAARQLRTEAMEVAESNKALRALRASTAPRTAPVCLECGRDASWGVEHIRYGGTERCAGSLSPSGTEGESDG